MINQGNRNNWVEWLKVPYDLGMAGSCIGSRNTYYKCLEDLDEWGLIEYRKGINNYKAPLVKICLLNNEQLTEQAPVPLCEQLTEPLSEQLPEHIYKLITNNLKLITDNLEKWVCSSLKHPKPFAGEKKKTLRRDSRAHDASSEKIYREFKKSNGQGKLKITHAEVESLMVEGYSQEEIDDNIDKIENSTSNKKYVSLKSTVRNWIKKQRKWDGIPLPSDPNASKKYQIVEGQDFKHNGKIIREIIKEGDYINGIRMSLNEGRPQRGEQHPEWKSWPVDGWFDNNEFVNV